MMNVHQSLPRWPLIRKSDLEQPELCALAARALSREWGVSSSFADLFMQSLRKHRLPALHMEPPATLVLNDEFRDMLIREWDRIRSLYDADTGRLNPVFVRCAAAEGLPEQLHQAAHARVAGQYDRSFGDAQAEVFAEHHVPLTHEPRIIHELRATEQETLREEAEAEARLSAVRQKIEKARSQAVGIISTRDRLNGRVQQLQAEIAEITQLEQLVSRRRARADDQMKRFLRSQARPWALLAEASASVAGFTVCLAELGRQLAEKQTALADAKKEISEFLTANAQKLEPVART